jgi:serine/threonine protein kinase
MGDPGRFDALKVLERYALIEKLSDGYLGPVYRSFDQNLKRAVEIRIFCDGITWDRELADLLRIECDRIAGSPHRNIASILELNVEGNTPFMVLEPLGKRSLRRLIGREPGISFESKISVMAQLAEGMAWAHKHGIVHWNLCPEDIYLTADGCVKIRDFAIAHVLRKHLPHPGVRWGAPIYLSPEQIRQKQCDERSDIFALGTISYELLTGSHPFYDPDGNKTLDNILQDRPVPTFERHPHFHPRIWQILKKCFANDPECRYRNAGEILGAYRDLLNEVSEDVHGMRGELQASFAALKTASECPDASDKCVRLCNNIWNILRGSEDPGYVRLDRLMTDLSEIYPEIQAASGKKNPPDVQFQPCIGPEDLRLLEEGDSLPEDAPAEEVSLEACVAARAGCAEGIARADDPQGVRPPASASGIENVAAVEYRDSDAEFHHGLPGRESSEISKPDKHDDGESEGPTADPRQPPSRKRRRIPRPNSRMTIGMTLILLALAAVHGIRGRGDAGGLFGTLKDADQNSWMTAKAAALKRDPSQSAAEASIGFGNLPTDAADSKFESELPAGADAARRINPADPGIAALRKEIGSGTASAASSLSVLRLGGKATILLDGEPVGIDGEARDASLSIGRHTVQVEKDGYLVASRRQEFYEGQTSTLVYDLVRREIRPMAESDRALLSRRQAMETVHSYPVEHDHGFLKGSCRGELSVSYDEVAYRPLSGEHGFAAPFRILRLEIDGRSVRLFFLSDNELFQKLKLKDEQAALQLGRTWNALKKFPQN